MEKVPARVPSLLASRRACHERTQTAVRLAGIAGLCIGSLVLLGWLLNLPVLKGILPGLALMQPNTAASIALAGLALLGLKSSSSDPRWRRISSILAAFVAMIGLLTLAESLFAVNLGIDRLLFGDAPGSIGSLSPGRMSLMTAFCVSCLGSALFLLRSSSRPGRGASQALALATALLALQDLIGYAHGARFLYIIPAYSTMALHTALAFWMLALGTLAALPDSGLMRRFMADDAGGWLLRNFLPLAVVLPLFAGGIRVVGEETGLFDPRFGSAVLVFSSIVILAGLLWYTAGRLSELDTGRRQAEHALAGREEFLLTTLKSIGDAVITTNAEGRVTFMNPVAEALTGWTQANAAGHDLGEVFRIVEESTRLPVENPVVQSLSEGAIVGLANHTVVMALDGTQRPIDDSTAPIRDAGGAIVGCILVFRDISERRREEERLAEARLRVEAALEAAGVGTWDFDVKNDVVRADRILAKLFGLTPEDAAAGRPLDAYTRAIHPDDGSRVAQAIDRALEAGESYEEEFRLVGPGGAVRWVVARGRIERDAAGGAVRMPGVVIDITRQRRAEEKLQTSEDQRRLALDSAELGAWNVNPAANSLNADERFRIVFQGSTDPITYEQAFAAIHPEDRQRIRDAVAAATRPDNPAPYAEEYRVVHRDGTVRWVFGKGRANFERVEQGRRLVSLDGTVMDITERKRAEQATRRRAFQFQKLAEIANRINTAHDVNSVIGVVTEEARNLIGAEQAVTSMVLDPRHPQPINVISAPGQPVREMSPSDVAGLRVHEAFNRTNESIRLTKGELEADPRWRMLGKLVGVGTTSGGWLAAPLVGRNGKNMGFIQLSGQNEGEFTDDDEAILVQLAQLTAIAVENARLYQELRSNDERKDEFLAMLAHELRNPLAAISNAVKVISLSRTKEHLDWSMEIISRQLLHLSRLIDDLMDVSRITRGKIDLRRDVMDVTPILESAAVTTQAIIEERKHTLNVNIDRGNLWASVDPTRLEQVVVNLLNNAAKYSENAGHIVLSARNEPGEIVISVKDSGMGIPPQKLPEMFELFAQGDRSLARSEGGLGIGLTVVKKLVEMHGGSIVARSEGPGKGSEFIIRIPAAGNRSEFRATPAGTREQSIKKARILVVDDNVDTARGMSRLLKILGHDVATAHNGPEAIDTAREYEPEFVLLDIGLPGMSGYEVAAVLRREECCKNALIVAISGYGQDEDRRRSKEAGFDHHLVKPLDHNALLSLLSIGGSASGRF